MTTMPDFRIGSLAPLSRTRTQVPDHLPPNRNEANEPIFHDDLSQYIK